MTNPKVENDTIKTLSITSPRFDIDEVRKVKSAVRFKTKNVQVLHAEDDMKMHDLNTICKYGRCTEIQTIGGALYKMTIRVAGTESDSVYELQPLYQNDSIYLTIENAYKINKDA